MTASRAKAAEALLAWYAAMGVDEAIGEAPVDCFAAPVAEPSPAPASQAKGLTRPLPVSAPLLKTGPGSAAARNAATLAELEGLVASFDGCALKRTAKSLCFARGGEDARLMLIGEAPGRDEDRIGKPFVGRAGQLLDKMLASIGLDRQKNAYITNVINWRPPDNRDPSPEEAAACLPFLRRHIELARPKVIILLGAVAARHVVGVSEGIMKLRGRWMEYRVGDEMVPLMPTLHPAYLLRQPAHKKLAWRDLQAVRDRMAALNLPETH
jgi:DNA polymerase